MEIFIILSSPQNWVGGISKKKIQLDFSNQYDQFEVQHAEVIMEIKEIMSIQRFGNFTGSTHSLAFTPFYIHLHTL